MNKEENTSSSTNSESSEIEDGQAEKKLKKELLEAEDQEVDGKESIIESLPPEMLMKILKYLDNKTIFVCRLVNRKFNEMASEVCGWKADVEIKLDCLRNRIGYALGMKHDLPKLKEFFRCFGDSENFPYSSFLCQVQNSTFVDKNWMKFITEFGENIKCLKLVINLLDCVEDDYLTPMTVTLSHQLLKQLPKLEELSLKFYDTAREMNMTDLSRIHLFPEPDEYTECCSHSEIPRLPHLKVLRLDESSFFEYNGIVTDILEAAVNLQKIEPLEKDKNFDVEGLIFLNSIGKLHCLQPTLMRPTLAFLTNYQKKLTPALDYKLKTLKLVVEEVYKNKEIWSSGAIFLSNVFKSSKDTLKELDMQPLRFLKFDKICFPKFSKLTNLCIQEGWDESDAPFLPAGIKFQNIFPVLQSLELIQPWSTAFPQRDCVSSIPTLETLKVEGKINKNDIAQISLMCPNLKDFKISDRSEEGSFENFSPVGKAIWRNLKKLESLWIEIDVGTDENSFPAIDSCITGISKTDCRRLRDLKAADKLLRRWESQVRVPQSEFIIERKYASILDLKDLINLTIRLVFYNEFGDERRGNLLNSALTSISEDYALKLMENLAYKIERNTI